MGKIEVHTIVENVLQNVFWEKSNFLEYSYFDLVKVCSSWLRIKVGAMIDSRRDVLAGNPLLSVSNTSTPFFKANTNWQAVNSTDTPAGLGKCNLSSSS